MLDLLENIWAVYLDTAFWLLLGLLAAGLVKVLIPADAMQRWLGGRGLGAIGRAALFGAPLPLCSCGVLPAALSLRRNGASREATVSFLISTPETSIDSVSVTYALMGPAMAVYRPIAALVSAVSTGLLTLLAGEDRQLAAQGEPVAACCSTETGKSCCDSHGASSCCDTDDHGHQDDTCCSSESPPRRGPVITVLRYAGAELLDDISHWLFIGIAVAGVMATVIPDGWLAQWGQGLGAMLVMVLVGVPMYICAVASTPIAAGLILSGVSPGTVLVFMLVGPATNLAGLMLLRKELGNRATALYIAGLSLVSIVMGLLLDALIRQGHVSVAVQLGAGADLLPYWLSLGAGILLLLLAVPGLRRRLFPILG